MAFGQRGDRVDGETPGPAPEVHERVRSFETSTLKERELEPADRVERPRSDGIRVGAGETVRLVELFVDIGRGQATCPLMTRRATR